MDSDDVSGRLEQLAQQLGVPDKEVEAKEFKLGIMQMLTDAVNNGHAGPLHPPPDSPLCTHGTLTVHVECL